MNPVRAREVTAHDKNRRLVRVDWEYVVNLTVAGVLAVLTAVLLIVGVTL